MNNPAEQDNQGFEYQGLPSSIGADRFRNPGADHEHQDVVFGDDFMTGFPFETIMPSSILHVSHTSHDDSCVDACPGVYNAQGLPRGTFPPPPPAPRSRMTSASLSYPHPMESPLFSPSTSQNYDFTYSFLDSNSEFKYPHIPGSKYFHHTPNHSQQLSAPMNTTEICTLPQCPVPAVDCASTDCSGACTDPSCSAVCEDEECEDEGFACDKADCFNDDVAATGFHYPWTNNQDFGFGQYLNHGFPPHGQPCNHTNAEHDVAFALQDFRNPGNAGHHQHPFFDAFHCPLFGQAELETLVPVAKTPALSNDDGGVSRPLSAGPGTSLEDMKETSVQHICRWRADGHTICGRTFSNEEQLHEHLGQDHVGQLTSKTQYLCLWEGCSRKTDQIFASRNKLRRHISTHTAFKPFKCDECGERFSAQQALDQHVRTHTGETPYKCDAPGCGKAFKQKSALTMHKRTHTGEKPLECEICGKRFCESSNLSKHRKIHAGEYKFACETCGRSFLRVDQLRRHQLKHDRAKEKGRGRSTSLANVAEGME